MKKFLAASAIFLALDANACDDWSNHYVKGIQLNQEKQYEKANVEFSAAVNLIKDECDESHIFIRTNRAKNYLQIGEFYKTLEDIHQVIDCPFISNKDLIDALEVRMRAYAALEMHSKFQEDYIWYKSLNPYMPIFEYSEKYIVIRHCEAMKSDDQEIMYGLFIAAGFCVDESKIIRLDDMIVIERKNTGLCHCKTRHPTENQTQEEKDIEKAKKLKLESCHYHCDIAARTASEMAGKLIQVHPAFFCTLIMVEVLKDTCKDCCGDNGGFYMNCIEPIREYYETIKKKLAQIVHHIAVNETKRENQI